MKKDGFTLIELIVTLALISIVLTLGVPSFREMLRQNQLSANVNQFVTALSLARSEAIKRGTRVTLCKSADRAECIITGGYDQGWIVFVDNNNIATVDPGEQILQVTSPLPDAMTLTGNTTVANFISFTAGGMTRLNNGGFQAGMLTLCADHKARQIFINSIGRARVAQSTC